MTAVFNESQRVFGARQQAREEREQQLKICKELHSKVSPMLVSYSGSSPFSAGEEPEYEAMFIMIKVKYDQKDSYNVKDIFFFLTTT